MNDYVVDAKDLTKVFTMGDVEVHALRGLSVQITRGDTLIIVTHDPEIAEQTQRAIHIRDGVIAGN